MSQIKSGKRPLSQRPQPAQIRASDVFVDQLEIPQKMIEVIKSKGFVHALINYKQYIDMGGVHSMGYRAISKKELREMGYDTIDTQSFLLGNDSDGYIRRGDLILAVRPLSVHQRHKAYIDQENERVSNMQGNHADALRELNRQHGSSNTVTEGYDDDEE